MHDSDRPPASAPERASAPTLIDEYRARRDAWHAQAKDLVRLREAALAAAEREAHDIVAAARRDVRQILIDARRRLLVLTAQLQAAVDGPLASSPSPVERVPSDPHGDDDLMATDGEAATLLTAGTTPEVVPDSVLRARRHVRGVLQGARPDLGALAAEARALRSSLRATAGAEGSAVPAEAQAPPVETMRRPLPHKPRLWLSKLQPQLVKVLVISLCAAAASVALGTTLWWFSESTTSRDATSQETPQPQRTSPAPTAESQPSPVGAGQSYQVGTDASPVSLRIEARRLAWIRATIDGRTDAGRLFRAGQTREIVGARHVALRVGDAGAVFVSVNGGEARPLGRDGQVVTRRFGREANPAPGEANRRATEESEGAEAPNSSSPTEPSGGAPVAVDVEQAPVADERAVESVQSVLSQETPGTGAIVADSATPPPLPPVPAERSEPSSEGTAVPAQVPADSAAQTDLLAAAEQWFDAYYRNDRATMAAIAAADPTISDQREAHERLPRGLANVTRAFSGVNVQMGTNHAIVSATMTEHGQADDQPLRQVSLVSQMWVRRGGSWHLLDVRLVSEAKVTRSLR